MRLTQRLKNHSLHSLAFLLLIATSNSSMAVKPGTPQFIDGGVAKYSADTSEFLGFSEELTLWEDGVVQLTYNHAGARSDVNADEIIADLQLAFEVIEGIADIDLQFLGTSGADPFDFNDDIVTIGWQQIGGSTIARAGPASSAFNSTITRLGYLPAVDGSFVFNSLHQSDYEISTMIHELMHLLGIGHSDSAVSIMTPISSRYDRPQADDVAVLQAMYGPPDTFVLETSPIDLGSSSRPGLSIDSSDSGVFFGENINAITKFTNVDSNFSDDDVLYLRLRYTGAQEGELLEVYITDPNGFSNLDQVSNLGFANGSSTRSIGSASSVFEIPGTWTVTVGLSGNIVSEFEFTVEEGLNTANQNPVAALVATPTGGGQFSLSVNATDPEGDAITIDWHLPGEGVFLNSGSSLFTSNSVTTPVRVLAAIRDNGIKRDGSSSGDGFGALLSQYLANPAEVNIPTYFVQEQILHIPSLLINGQNFGVNFELTALPGAQFKLLDLFASGETSATTTIDLSTAVLTIPRIIVQDNGVNSEFQNLQFDLVPNSNPVKFSLRL